MGSKFRTILNLEVIKSDIENGLIYIKGSIPGSKNTTVFLRKSKKTFNRKTSLEKFTQDTKIAKPAGKKEDASKKPDNQTKKAEPKKK